MDQKVLALLNILSDGNYHSITSLGKQLDCSSSTLLLALSDIKEHEIELSTNDDYIYRWKHPVKLLNQENIFRFLVDYSNSFVLEVFNSIDSTNSYLLKNLNKYRFDKDSIPVVAAEIQTKGRGRINRSWISGFGNGLTFSLLRCFEYDVSKLSGLSLIIGIAIVRVLRLFSNSNIYLKWPNDILFDNKKLAGILVELRGRMHGPTYSIIGIGINFQLSESIKSNIQQDTIDLYNVTGKIFDRNEILAALLIQLRDILYEFEYYGFAHFRDEWTDYHICQGKHVKIILPSDIAIEGIVDGVNSDGSICILTASGRQSFNVGDISMRQID